jgi:tripartite-type tricarboxylate transporter receptor subunit TctC
MITRRRALQLSSSMLLGTTPFARAQDADFYKGKQLQIVCATEAGGLYDFYSRLLAKHMPRHIPGNPAPIVQNMPGGGSIKAANYLYNVAPKDGTVILGSHSAISTLALTAADQAKFDVNAFNWIGSVTKDPFVAFVWHTAPAKTLEDLKKVEIVMGGASVGTAGVDMLLIANALFGFKMKLVAGYKSATDVKLALERGEVQGTFANGWSDVKTQSMTWLKEGKIRVVAQHGFKPHPELKDVPLFMDEAKTDADRQALVFMLARQEAAKPYFAPPGVPEARMAILRAAFDATMKDPEFLKDAATQNLAVEEPLTGAEVAALVKSASSTPAEVVNRVQAILAQGISGR